MFNGYWTSFKRVNCPGCDSVQAPLSTATFKKEWNDISASPTYQRVVDRDKCSSSNSGGSSGGSSIVTDGSSGSSTGCSISGVGSSSSSSSSTGCSISGSGGGSGSSCGSIGSSDGGGSSSRTQYLLALGCFNRKIYGT